MSSAGYEKYLVDLARGLRHAAADKDAADAADLRGQLSEAYDITVVAPPPPRMA
jgi:hypothetical protein